MFVDIRINLMFHQFQYLWFKKICILFQSGFEFNGRLTWFNHINVDVDKIYRVLLNLLTVTDSTTFAMSMQFARSKL